jgi:hypothetical protein
VFHPGVLTEPLTLRDREASPLAAAAVESYSQRVGGLTVRVEATAPSLKFLIDDASRRFLVEDGRPDLALRVSTRPLEARADGLLVFDSRATWTLHDRGGRHVYRFFDPRLGPSPYKEARIAPDLASGDVFLHPDFHAPGEPVDALQFPLDELLFLHLLAARGGVELHACGVVAPSGRGYVFAGQSGDGKTTMARLWERLPGATVLSDDRIVVRRGASGYVMYGTPWHGEAELATAACAPLAAICLLARGEWNALEPLTPAASVAGLLARSIIPRQVSDRAAMGATLGFLEGLTREIPCRRYRFVPDSLAPRFALEQLR